LSLWYTPGVEVILASNSPRRREILKNMGLIFTSVSPAIEDEESYLRADAVRDSIVELSEAKASSVASKYPESLIIGSDTLVFSEGEILGKPRDRADALAMLKKLSGRIHTVYTGLSLLYPSDCYIISECAETKVRFRSISDEEIDSYLDLEEYGDKAGAYAIQGRAMNFVEEINGCFYNVMGLPVSALIRLFTAFQQQMMKGYC